MIANRDRSQLHLDHYLISTLYSSWVEGEHEREGVFELFFRKNPFKGEYTIFLGLANVMDYLENFKIDQETIKQFKSIKQFSEFQEKFWDYLMNLSTSSLKVYAMKEGTICFPHEPLMQVIGPLSLANLVGTAFLCLTSYPSLVATNATRFRLAADAINLPECKLFEFGLRRAQGPGAALIASISAYIGGFDATSNLDAHEKFGIPTCGTTDHTSILVGVANRQQLSKTSTSDHKFLLNKKTDQEENFTLKCLEIEEDFVKRIVTRKRTIEEDHKLRRRSELRSFIKVAITNKSSFAALVDTYDVIVSGLVNYCIVALALHHFGYCPLGIRIDSGDSAYLSRCAKSLFKEVAEEYEFNELVSSQIIVSNEISIKVILSLLGQKHAITGFGIGTNLVTCGKQPTLGTVYKMVEIQGIPCQKSTTGTLGSGKSMITCRKSVYRLYSDDNQALVDLMIGNGEQAPKAGHPVLCKHPFDPNQQCVIKPNRVEPLLHLWWDGKLIKKMQSIEEIRTNCLNSLTHLREDIKRFMNPTPYKVSVSDELLKKLNTLKSNTQN
uniref:Nicotinate phosphoribosyltransferase n=1 Tax=Aceria tosichella TaxID=561515 RepID=A0A6G1SBS3_9ACAR